MVFHQKLLEKAFFIDKMIGPAMVESANSDFWKAPLEHVAWATVQIQAKPEFSQCYNY